MDVSGNVGFAILLTALAGLSTGIGSAIDFAIRKPKAVYLSFGLGFSAGASIPQWGPAVDRTNSAVCRSPLRRTGGVVVRGT